MKGGKPSALEHQEERPDTKEGRGTKLAVVLTTRAPTVPGEFNSQGCSPLGRGCRHQCRERRKKAKEKELGNYELFIRRGPASKRHQY